MTCKSCGLEHEITTGEVRFDVYDCCAALKSRVFELELQVQSKDVFVEAAYEEISKLAAQLKIAMDGLEQIAALEASVSWKCAEHRIARETLAALAEPKTTPGDV